MKLLKFALQCHAIMVQSQSEDCEQF